MKNHQTATRVLAGVLPAMALFATPALAQISTQTTPPPVPAAAAPAPAAEPAAPQAVPDQSKYQASLNAATGKTATPDAVGPVARTARPAARAASARVAPSRAPARAVAASAPATTAPVAVAPVEAVVPPATQPVADAPAPSEAATTTTVETAPVKAAGTPSWLWLVAGLAGLAVVLLGLFALRNRRTEDPFADDHAGELPVAADFAEPANLAPLAHGEAVAEHAELVAPEVDEIAAMTEAAAPVAGRPWIELSLRPLRAGATDESALVDVELTLANAGEVEARNVRVSTFMLGDAGGAPTDMDRLLTSSHAGTHVDAGVIAAGQGAKIDASLAVPREGMAGATFQPLVGVDVRYTLPNGSEGRTAAAFMVGVYDESDEPTPLRLGGDMREDVAATLHGVAERA